MASRIRVAHTLYPAGGPFNDLKKVDYIDYEENLPSENARRLHEGEVDVALISTSQFALHGGYIGLDFGLYCREHSDLIRLFSHTDVRQLSTIYVHEHSSSSVLLLRMLLQTKWRTSPRLLRAAGDIDVEGLAPSEGILMRQEGYEECERIFEFSEDLVSHWHQMHGHPFVFLVWATRPGVLSLEQLREFRDLAHRLTKLEGVESMNTDEGGSEQLEMGYYFDSSLLNSFNRILKEANLLNLLPRAIYQQSTFTLLDQRPKNKLTPRSLSSILEQAHDGKRLSIRDGMRLANEATLADLALAADALRKRFFPQRSISYVYSASIDKEEDVQQHINSADRHGASRILLLPPFNQLNSIERFEQIIIQIKSKSSQQIEGFGVPGLIKLAETVSLPVEQVVGRLVTAGLDAVPAFGGGMLIDRIMSKKAYQKFSAEEWLTTMKWIHRYGARSACSMLLSPHETWEERLIHLQKLRAIQDENPGFRFMFCQVAPDWVQGPTMELKLRATAISRLFLDNIPAMLETETTTDPVLSTLSLSFGGNAVRLQVGKLHKRAIDEARLMFQDLRASGFDLAEDGLDNELPYYLPPSMH